MLVLAGAVGAAGAVVALAASPGPAPLVSSVRFLGLGADRVGLLNDARPNGERDGHFRVVLDLRGRKRTLLGVAVQHVLAGGGLQEQWDVNGGTSPSILGLYLNGRRMNSADREVKVALSGRAPVRLDLYANDLGAFAPGERYRVVVAFEDFVTAQRTIRLPGSSAGVTASFLGRGDDLVGRANDPNPNGEPDGHWAVQLSTRGAWRILKDVAVRRVNAQGSPEAEGWDANPGTSFSGLAVLLGGKRLRQPAGRLGALYPLYAPLAPGAYRLDLWGNDPNPGLFVGGQTYRVTVFFTDALIAPETYTVVRL